MNNYFGFSPGIEQAQRDEENAKKNDEDVFETVQSNNVVSYDENGIPETHDMVVHAHAGNYPLPGFCEGELLSREFWVYSRFKASDLFQKRNSSDINSNVINPLKWQIKESDVLQSSTRYGIMTEQEQKTIMQPGKELARYGNVSKLIIVTIEINGHYNSTPFTIGVRCKDTRLMGNVYTNVMDGRCLHIIPPYARTETPFRKMCIIPSPTLFTEYITLFPDRITLSDVKDDIINLPSKRDKIAHSLVPYTNPLYYFMRKRFYDNKRDFPYKSYDNDKDRCKIPTEQVNINLTLLNKTILRNLPVVNGKTNLEMEFFRIDDGSDPMDLVDLGTKLKLGSNDEDGIMANMKYENIMDQSQLASVNMRITYVFPQPVRNFTGSEEEEEKEE